MAQPGLRPEPKNGRFAADAKYHNTMTYNTAVPLSGNLFQFLRVSSTEKTERPAVGVGGPKGSVLNGASLRSPVAFEPAFLSQERGSPTRENA